MPALDHLLAATANLGASDLHLSAGHVPRARVHGHLEPIDGQQALRPADLEAWMESLCDADRWERFRTTRDVDFAIAMKGLGRFRVNYFEQERGVAAVFRRIPEEILPLAELRMPPQLERLADLRQGLVLVTGPTGSGKSTTLAAILNEINDRHARHVVTIEDPVEFLHPNRRCVFSHREVGSDCDSFADALRAAVRQDAEVLLVGEMRDLETISLALGAAEMGALVFSTLHTNSAAKTIDRLIDAFPAEQQSRIRVSLAESLQAVVAQLLVPTIDGKGRRAATEILLRTTGLANVIRESNTAMIRSILQTGKKRGMRTLDDSLRELVSNGEISLEEARRRAHDKEAFPPSARDEAQAPAAVMSPD